MRLLNPGLGEIADRLTILSLKLLYGEQAGKPTDHFRNERNALLTQVNAKNNFQAWFEHGLALGAVNAALWQAEDQLRDYRAAPPPAGGRTEVEALTSSLQFYLGAAQTAFKIQAFNDRRAELIAQINSAVGENLGAEKVSV